MNIEVSDEIIEKIKKRLEGSEFKTAEEYVNYVLKELVSEEGAKPAEVESKQVYSEEDKEKIKERLRGLGYIE